MMLCFCLYWGSNSTVLHTVFGIKWDVLLSLPFGNIFKPVLKLQFMAILSLPLILYRGSSLKVKLPKWVGYSLYPAHLVLLILMEGMNADGWEAVYHRMMGLVVNPVLRLLNIG